MGRDADQRLTIGEVARASGLHRSAIRYYETVGVLPAPGRVSGQRRYEPGVLRDLALIRTAQAAGFSLAEIGEILRSSGARANERLRVLAREHASAVDDEIARLTGVRAWLGRAETCECRDLGACELFAATGCGR